MLQHALLHEAVAHVTLFRVMTNKRDPPHTPRESTDFGDGRTGHKYNFGIWSFFGERCGGVQAGTSGRARSSQRTTSTRRLWHSDPCRRHLRASSARHRRVALASSAVAFKARRTPAAHRSRARDLRSIRAEAGLRRGPFSSVLAHAHAMPWGGSRPTRMLRTSWQQASRKRRQKV